MEYEHNDEYLCHHGIKGQKWGTKNGPPYPLKEGQKSSSETNKKQTQKKQIKNQKK